MNKCNFLNKKLKYKLSFKPFNLNKHHYLDKVVKVTSWNSLSSDFKKVKTDTT